MILIDEPVWPAHGTLWGHVVSDRSLEELHAFARVAGLPELQPGERVVIGGYDNFGDCTKLIIE